MDKKWIWIGVGAVAVIGIIFGLVSITGKPKTAAKQQLTIGDETYTLATQKKPSKVIATYPKHGAVLPAPPLAIVIGTKSDLSGNDTIAITKDTKEYHAGVTTIDTDNITFRRSFEGTAPNGLYTVNYKLCDESGTKCSDGRLQFGIDKAKAAEYTDLRREKVVTIKLKNHAYSQPKIRISRGTKVIWMNEESDQHTVTTEPHDGDHFYYPSMNSNELDKGESFIHIFTQPGYYPYHCHFHDTVMKATIIVEN